MGDLSNKDACENFIKEFGEDILKHFTLKYAEPNNVVRQILHFDPGEGWVYHAVVLRLANGEERTYRDVDEGLFYSVWWNEDELLDEMNDVFNLPEVEIKERLRRAGLLERDDHGPN